MARKRILTGITNEMLQNEADETEVIPEFINWVNKEKPQYFSLQIQPYPGC